MKEAVLCIAAGWSQIPLLRAAGELGFDVLAVDQDEGAPGLRYATEHIRASTHDAEAVMAGLQPHRANYDVKGVVTKSSGSPVATTATLAHALGLRGLDPLLARRAVSKAGQMELCRNAGVPRPRSAVCGSLDELLRTELDFPLVLKPSHGVVGKQGVCLVQGQSELVGAFERARRSSAERRVQAEAFVAGRDVIVAGLMNDSIFLPFALIDEETIFEPDGRARGYGFTLPSRYRGTEEEGRLHELAGRIVETNQLGYGIALFTFRVGLDGRPNLIEMHFDLAGDHLTDRLFAAAGTYDPIRSTLRLLTGERPELGADDAQPTALRFLFAEDLAEHAESKLAVLRTLPGHLSVETFENTSGQPDGRRGMLLERRTSTPDPEREAEIERILGRARKLAA